VTARPASQLAASIFAYPTRVEKPALARAKIGGMAWRGSSCFGIPNLGDFNANFPCGTIRNSGDFTFAFGFF
jgi:hypothetical protein